MIIFSSSDYMVSCFLVDEGEMLQNFWEVLNLRTLVDILTG